MLGATIRLCTKDLKPFSITAGIYMMAFAQFAFLIFGTSLESYGTFVGTLEALFAFALGDFDFVSYKVRFLRADCSKFTAIQWQSVALSRL